MNKPTAKLPQTEHYESKTTPKRHIRSGPARLALCASAQGYSVDWSKVAGGGGTSTGGIYSVSGTIGQPDASAAMTGGNYSVTGGFWSLIAVAQTPGAPYLSVTLTSTNTVCVWWAVSPTDWQLQATAGLVSGGSTWTPCSYTTNGANCVYIESLPVGNRFYRLYHP